MALPHLLGLIRLVHPFPSLLNAVVTGVLATIAGAPPAVAVRLGASMAAFQFSIGSLNDLVDAPADARSGREKPIPARRVTPTQARAIAIAGFVVGLLLAVPSGLPAVGIGVSGAALGFAYDLRLKGSAFSWAPLAGAIPLVPLFAWVGSGAPVPVSFSVLLPAGALAGAALAIGNALADAERDQVSGSPNVAVRLGLDRAWWLLTGLHAGVVVVASTGALLLPGGGPRDAATIAVAGVVLVAGVAAARGSGWLRVHAWEVQAVGTGLLAVTYLLVVGT